MNVDDDAGGFIIFRAGPFRADEPEPGASAEWIEHCRSREFAERAAAKRATCSEARKIHQQLAQAYARMIRGAGGE